MILTRDPLLPKQMRYQAALRSVILSPKRLSLANNYFRKPFRPRIRLPIAATRPAANAIGLLRTDRAGQGTVTVEDSQAITRQKPTAQREPLQNRARRPASGLVMTTARTLESPPGAFGAGQLGRLASRGQFRRAFFWMEHIFPAEATACHAEHTDLRLGACRKPRPRFPGVAEIPDASEAA